MSQDQVRTFAHTIAAINHGALDDELSDDLSKLLATLQREASTQGKARGKITLVLSLKVEQNGVVTIVPESKIVEPKPVRSNAVFWIDKEGKLAKSDPRQVKLPLRDVGGGGPVKDAGAPAAAKGGAQ